MSFSYTGALALIAFLQVVQERLAPDRPTTVWSQIHNQPQASVQPIAEPHEDIDIRSDRNVKSESRVTPKFEQKAAPQVEAKVEPRIEPKVKAKGDRAASIELYRALRARKPVSVIE